ncbi:protein of unknown function DUF980 [Pirellula staleyi DSM 6068]|uniref:Uncharacterized protein n=1 Tax=Pirellula staleyi (strain ATCC 27377 / DSM 6068 / ICPB 4128) TaxID=530564 RepID=D2R514_PIRSD|nr:zinc-dependent peptidase [Pirellula staleyi]ADB18976.1 protein of unknown function DUF980 [Pirellula staleyi DSM 6068]
MLGNWFKRSRRAKLLSSPLASELLKSVEANIEVYSLLTPPQRVRLIECARIIAAEREWVGCRGLEVTDAMKLTVSAIASLLLLGTEGYYFERVPSFLLYPFAYRRPIQNREGGMIDETATILGEAHPHGSIVLSWPAVLAGGKHARDGENLVLHELAHHIDGLDGAVDGVPPLNSVTDARFYEEAFAREFSAHQDHVRQGIETLIDAYGATNRAEFFAVSTELFYEQPLAMRARHPDWYKCLTLVYSLDPAQWFEAGASTARVNISTSSRDDQHPMPVHSQHPHHEQHELSDDERAEAIASLPKLRTADQYFTRAVEWMEAAEWDVAEADLTHALALDPNDQETYVYRSRARCEQGLYDLALEDAEHALQLLPSDPEAIGCRGICRVAIGGEVTAGLADIKKAQAAKIDNDELWFFRAMAEVDLGDAAAAVKSFSKVIDRSPHDGEALAHRGLCYELLGQNSLAEADFARAQELGVEVSREDLDSDDPS